MHSTFREKFVFELFIEKTWNAFGLSISELVTDTWLEFFILDPIGRYAAVTAIALILALCVGRLHTIYSVCKDTIDISFAYATGGEAKSNDDGANGGHDLDSTPHEDAAIYEDGLDDETSITEANLVSRFQSMRVTSTPKKFPPTNPSVIVRRGANTANVMEYRTPPQRTGHVSVEGDMNTIRKRKEQLNRLKMWS